MTTQSLIERIKEDHTTSRKARNSIKSNLLGTIIAECDTLSKDARVNRALTDDEIVTIVQRTRKKMLESIEMIDAIESAEVKASRSAQKTQLLQEREMLEPYLPQQLTREELERIAIDQEVLNKNLGQIMSYLKKNYAGRYDPALAHDVIKKVVGFEQR